MANFIQGNVRSLNTSCKFVEDICVKDDIKVLCLSEIWHPDVNNINFLHQWEWYKSERTEPEGGGTALIIRPDIKSIPRKEICCDFVEMSWCEIFIENTAILLGCIYIRPDDSVAMDKFTDIINNLTERNIIITGDFNAKHISWFNDHNNKVGEKLNDFINASEFIILNDEAPTYKNSIIDLTIIKGCTNLVKEWDVKPNVYIKSDHNVIKFVVGLRDVSVKKKIWRVNNADWSEWKKESDKVFESLVNSDNVSIEEMYQNIKTNIHGTAVKVIGKSNVSYNHKAWWTDELQKKKKEINEARKRFKRRSSEINHQRLLAVKTQFYNLYCEERNKYLQRMIHNLDMDQKTKWNTIKKFSNYPVKKCIQPIIKDGKTIFKDEEIAEEFLNGYCSSEIKVNADIFDDIERKAKDLLNNEQNSHKVYIPTFLSQL